MAKKIHAFGWDPAPNESDPEGYEYSVCDTEDFNDPRGTHNWAEVTCKRCLALIEKQKPLQQ